MSYVYDALESSMLLSLFYRVKNISIYCYMFLAINVNRADQFFDSDFNDSWCEIDNAEKNICKVLYEYNIDLNFLGVGVFYNHSYLDFLFKHYLYGEINFSNCHVKKVALSRLISHHTVLNVHLLKVCYSIM